MEVFLDLSNTPVIVGTFLTYTKCNNNHDAELLITILLFQKIQESGELGWLSFFDCYDFCSIIVGAFAHKLHSLKDFDRQNQRKWLWAD